MAMMAAPVGFLGGYLTWKLRNARAAVIVPMLTFLSMLGARFLAS